MRQTLQENVIPTVMVFMLVIMILLALLFDFLELVHIPVMFLAAAVLGSLVWWFSQRQKRRAEEGPDPPLVMGIRYVLVIFLFGGMIIALVFYIIGQMTYNPPEERRLACADIAYALEADILETFEDQTPEQRYEHHRGRCFQPQPWEYLEQQVDDFFERNPRLVGGASDWPDRLKEASRYMHWETFDLVWSQYLSARRWNFFDRMLVSTQSGILYVGMSLVMGVLALLFSFVPKLKKIPKTFWTLGVPGILLFVFWGYYNPEVRGLYREIGVLAAMLETFELLLAVATSMLSIALVSSELFSTLIIPNKYVSMGSHLLGSITYLMLEVSFERALQVRVNNSVLLTPGADMGEALVIVAAADIVGVSVFALLNSFLGKVLGSLRKVESQAKEIQQAMV